MGQENEASRSMLKPVTEAAIEVFNSLCGVTLTLSPDTSGSDTPAAAVTSVITMKGVDCSVFLALPPETAVQVAKKFAGFEIPFESADMNDAVGELGNILAGTVKNRLDHHGIKAEISLPNVTRGEGLALPQGPASLRELACLHSPMGKMWTGVIAA